MSPRPEAVDSKGDLFDSQEKIQKAELERRLIGEAANYLEELVRKTSQSLGFEVSLAGLLLDRDKNENGFNVAYNEYHSEVEYPEEFIHPVVESRNLQDFFALGGKNFENLYKIVKDQLTRLDNIRLYRINWGGSEGIRDYWEGNDVSVSWWSDKERVFMRDGDDDILLPSITMLWPGDTIEAKMFHTPQLRPLFSNEESCDAFIMALQRAGGLIK